MGRQGVIGVAMVVLLGYIAFSSGEYQYALNYGVELSDLEKEVPVAAGLAFGFYSQSCPSAESIVASSVAAFLKSDGGGVAAGLVRLMFHDCFVQGCDGSILLKLASGSELNAIPNQTIRPVALQVVNDIKTRLEKACSKVVSCADIVVLSAKAAVQQSGGPTFNVPLGRRDALAFSKNTSDLPSPFTSFAQQKTIFTAKGLTDTADLVALAGAHTLGVAHCGSFSQRLLPTVDPKMNPNYAGYLIKNVCPTLQSSNSTGLDFFSPNHFDNQYFKNLPTGGALMASDQNLDQDTTAWSLVNQWAGNQNAFFSQFATSFIKMSQITTLTGNKGEIRSVCSTTNSGKMNVPLDEPEAKVEHILSTPTYTPSLEPELISLEPELISLEPDLISLEPELISMVTEGTAQF